MWILFEIAFLIAFVLIGISSFKVSLVYSRFPFAIARLTTLQLTTDQMQQQAGSFSGSLAYHD
jgi:hypothetical protein